MASCEILETLQGELRLMKVILPMAVTAIIGLSIYFHQDLSGDMTTLSNGMTTLSENVVTMSSGLDNLSTNMDYKAPANHSHSDYVKDYLDDHESMQKGDE